MSSKNCNTKLKHTNLIFIHCLTDQAHHSSFRNGQGKNKYQNAQKNICQAIEALIHGILLCIPFLSQQGELWAPFYTSSHLWNLCCAVCRQPVKSLGIHHALKCLLVKGQFTPKRSVGKTHTMHFFQTTGDCTALVICMQYCTVNGTQT